jgi:pimeloyl-ACP methyl ester carboxylesterase
MLRSHLGYRLHQIGRALQLSPQNLSWGRRVASLLGFVLAGYGALALIAFLGQRFMIYPAPRRGIEPVIEGARIERIGQGSDTVYALHSPARAGAPTIVHFHGNGEEISDLEWLAYRLRARGLGLYAVEYPGYGLALDGSPSETALYAAAERALQHLERALGVRKEQSVLQGQSLGSGIAVEMARRGYGNKLVLISPYTSMVDMAALVAPFLPTRWLVRDRYDNLKKVAELRLPALVLHGSEDEVIPIAMGREVAAALGGSRLVVVPGAHHNDLFDRDGPFDEVVSFAESK